MVYSPGTFKYDNIARDINGKPIGKVVLPTWFKYEKGVDIPVIVLKIPCAIMSSVFDAIIYIDEYAYKIPKSGIKSFKINKRGNDWIVSNFMLAREK